VCKVWLEVDSCAEEVEGTGSLARTQVHQAQVVRHHPLKRPQVHCTLQAGDGCYVALHAARVTESQAHKQLVSNQLILLWVAAAHVIS